MSNGDSLAAQHGPGPRRYRFTSPKVRQMVMTSQNPQSVDALENVPVRDPFGRRARAYCGPAHGQCWVLDADIELLSVVWLEDGTGSAAYQVTFDPVTRRPARDRHGNFVYMPLR
jgi:hypothetical protein